LIHQLPINIRIAYRNAVLGGVGGDFDIHSFLALNFGGGKALVEHFVIFVIGLEIKFPLQAKGDILDCAGDLGGCLINRQLLGDGGHVGGGYLHLSLDYLLAADHPGGESHGYLGCANAIGVNGLIFVILASLGTAAGGPNSHGHNQNTNTWPKY